jgi:predicted transcriptional regulator
MACLPDDVKRRRSLRDAALLLAIIAQGEADVRAGRTRPQADVFADLSARLTEDPSSGSGESDSNDP